MSAGREIRPGGVGGRIRVPPSKSVGNRYLNLALLARREIAIERLLDSDDLDAFLRALAGLGWRIETSEPSAGGRTVRLRPGALPERARIDCRASGTLARFLTAALSTFAGEWRLDGTARLRQRPMGPLVEALRTLGAEIASEASDGCLPLAVRGGALAGGAVRLSAGESSQYPSALLMAATRADGPLSVELDDLVSAPYLDLTGQAVQRFGGVVDWTSRRSFTVHPGLSPPQRVAVEGDFSSAAYWAAAAAITGGEVELAGLDPESRQGDRGFLDILGAMGARLGWRQGILSVAGGETLQAVDRDLAAMPDQVPTLAVLAPFARGTTVIRGAAHLRLKESDRLAALVAGLEAAGAEARETADGLEIPGVWAGSAPPANPVAIDPHADHRIAMAFAVLGLARPGVSIADPDVVAKSYPGFWNELGTAQAR